MSAILLILVIIILIIYNSYVNKKFDEQKNLINELKKKIDALADHNIDKINLTSIAETIVEKPDVFASKNKERVLGENSTETKETKQQSPNFINHIFAFVQQNFLSILGILTLVLGIGYFVKYAIDQNWINENLRVSLGIVAGIVLIGIGYFLRKNYAVFSSILCGGGISVFYFTITIAFREYHLFSQNITFGILIFITCIAVFLAYYLKREVLIIFAILGGFASPLMISTGQGNYPFLFGYIAVLNFGMLLITFLRNWKSVGWMCFVLTSIYLTLWIIDRPQQLALYFILFFYGIFYFFGLRNYFRKQDTSLLDFFFLILINLVFIPLSIILNKSLHLLPDSILALIFAVPNLFFAVQSYRYKKSTITFSIFVGIFVSLVSLGIALQFKVHFITIFWAIESSLLLYLWTLTKKSIFKYSFFVLIALSMIALGFTFGHYENNPPKMAFFNPIFISSLLVFATYIFDYQIIKKLNSQLKSFLFTISYLILYVSIFLELVYIFQNTDTTKLIIIVTLYSIYFVFGLLLVFPYFFKGYVDKKMLVAILLCLFILISGTTGLSSSIIERKISFGFYALYSTYLLSFFVIMYKFFVVPETELLKGKIQWFAGFVLTFVICYEMYHLFLWLNMNENEMMNDKIFSRLYLPIIWTLIGIAFIYQGIRKSKPEFNKMGIVLIVAMMIKLYTFDVWQMDQVSRIIAFIVLGILLLISSFMFQKLKKMFQNIIDKNH